jgi:hypothetical protein
MCTGINQFVLTGKPFNSSPAFLTKGCNKQVTDFCKSSGWHNRALWYLFFHCVTGIHFYREYSYILLYCDVNWGLVLLQATVSVRACIPTWSALCWADNPMNVCASNVERERERERLAGWLAGWKQWIAMNAALRMRAYTVIQENFRSLIQLQFPAGN